MIFSNGLLDDDIRAIYQSAKTDRSFTDKEVEKLDAFRAEFFRRCRRKIPMCASIPVILLQQIASGDIKSIEDREVEKYLQQYCWYD